MILLTAEKIKKSYTEKTLLQDINLTINSGDKIGLIGVNGTGKSTLLKIIAGVLEAEGGNIIKSRELRSAYLPQNPLYEKDFTVLQQATKYLEDSGHVFPEYQCKAMLTKLGIIDFEKKMDELSGGQRKRVAMAATFVSESNFLILDEPTNHMDHDVIKWLEDFLISYKGAILMITHDRYFLDRITNRIIEIDKGMLYEYAGNYDYYLETKEARMEMSLASERKRQAIYKKELVWIRRGAKARTTKAKGRIQRFHDLEESKLVLDEAELDINTITSRLGKKIIELDGISKSYGNKLLIDNFSYTFLRNDRVGIIGPNGCGKSTLLNIIMGYVEADSGRVDKGETVRIGYFSQENQALDKNQRVIKYIADISANIKTKSGSFSASQMLERFLFPPNMHSVEIGRLSGGEQRRLYLLSILMTAPNVLILDEPTNDLDIETLTVLEDYLDDFNGAVIVVSHDRYFLDRVVRKIFAFPDRGPGQSQSPGPGQSQSSGPGPGQSQSQSQSSGPGQIQSQSQSQSQSPGPGSDQSPGPGPGQSQSSGPDQSQSQSPGPGPGPGQIKAYNGGYTDYETKLMEAKRMESKHASAKHSCAKDADNEILLSSKNLDRPASVTDEKTTKRSRTQKLKFSFNEQREYDTIEDEIQNLEDEINSVKSQMAKHATDFDKLTKLTEQQNALEERLIEKLERWEYLTDLAQRIEAQRQG